MALPIDHDLATIRSWDPEMQAEYILGLQESLKRMRPVVAAAQDLCLAATSESRMILERAVEAYQVSLNVPKTRDGRDRASRDLMYDDPNYKDFWR